jgi:hypothetical protein
MAKLSRTCRVDGREGRFYLVRRGPKNCRVRAIDDPKAESVLVPTHRVQDIQQSATATPQTKVPNPQTSLFRVCLERLRDEHGSSASWELFQAILLEAAFARMRDTSGGYKGEVFVERDTKTYPECSKEEHFVANLFHEARANQGRVLRVDDDSFWLLGFEWPNQGGDAEKKRRADLVGLNESGGLVVFECKLAANSDPPAIAFAEGLDYASHLMRQGNAARIQAGFASWRAKQTVPDSFIDVAPDRNEPMDVVLLAPREYYEKHNMLVPASTRLSDRVVRLRMATCDFRTPVGHWWPRPKM